MITSFVWPGDLWNVTKVWQESKGKLLCHHLWRVEKNAKLAAIQEERAIEYWIYGVNWGIEN